MLQTNSHTFGNTVTVTVSAVDIGPTTWWHSLTSVWEVMGSSSTSVPCSLLVHVNGDGLILQGAGK